MSSRLTPKQLSLFKPTGHRQAARQLYFDDLDLMLATVGEFSAKACGLHRMNWDDARMHPYLVCFEFVAANWSELGPRILSDLKRATLEGCTESHEYRAVPVRKQIEAAYPHYAGLRCWKDAHQ